MTLFLLILAFVSLGIIIRFYPKSYSIIMFFTITSVIFSYFSLSKNFPEHSIFPQKYQYVNDCRYNRLIYALKQHRFDIEDSIPQILKDKNILTTFTSYLPKNPNLFRFYDLSIYNCKIYIYWGLTPVLLFYYPFNILTNLCISDNAVVFFSVSLIFILSLLILRRFMHIYIDYNKSTNMKVLFFYFSLLIGYCNYSLFLAIRPSICEVVISCAALLLLSSIYLFIELIYNNTKHTNLIMFFIGLFLSLSVGCRPHYIIFIPIFYIFIIYIQHQKTKNIKELLKSSFFFILPCIIYGTILALYNYLRFDSIFEFGWKFQLNHFQQYLYTPKLIDFITGLKYHLFQLPETNKEEYVLFSLCKVDNLRIGNELISGLIYVSPMSILILLMPLIYFTKQNKKAYQLIILFTLLFIINFLIACLFGAIQRYVFEYMYIAILLTSLLFIIFYNSIKNKSLILIIFIILIIYTIYININLLLCFNNLILFLRIESLNFYSKLINFLFNANFSFNFIS